MYGSKAVGMIKEVFPAQVNWGQDGYHSADISSEFLLAVFDEVR